MGFFPEPVECGGRACGQAVRGRRCNATAPATTWVPASGAVADTAGSHYQQQVPAGGCARRAVPPQLSLSVGSLTRQGWPSFTSRARLMLAMSLVWPLNWKIGVCEVGAGVRWGAWWDVGGQAGTRPRQAGGAQHPTTTHAHYAATHTWMGPGERHQSWMAQMARMEV